MQQILPADVDVPGSFETIGSIAHFNLRSGHLPFKHLIGQVCLDKNPAIKTVVTKVKEIENQYRVFDMEVIAGVPSANFAELIISPLRPEPCTMSCACTSGRGRPVIQDVLRWRYAGLCQLLEFLFGKFA